MLVLTRKALEKIHIGDNIVITISKVKGRSVCIGIEAPDEVRILREELNDDSVPASVSSDQSAAAADSPCAAENPTPGQQATARPRRLPLMDLVKKCRTRARCTQTTSV